MAEELKFKGIEIPKELKKEVEKPIELDLPKGVVEDLEKINKDKQKLVNAFVSVSFQLVNMQQRQIDLNQKIHKNNKDFNGKIDYAVMKLKLKKRKEYKWSFNGKDKFIGVKLPKPQPKEK